MYDTTTRRNDISFIIKYNEKHILWHKVVFIYDTDQRMYENKINDFSILPRHVTYRYMLLYYNITLLYSHLGNICLDETVFLDVRGSEEGAQLALYIFLNTSNHCILTTNSMGNF